ncbi:MAG: zinc ribbon domain-containing protein, partial [Myxococcota bacterium]
DLLNGFCATSLIGYLVGWPVGTFGDASGRRIRFFLAGALVSGGALFAAGWPVVVAIALACIGTAIAIVLDDLVRAMSPSQPARESAPAAEADLKLAAATATPTPAPAATPTPATPTPTPAPAAATPVPAPTPTPQPEAKPVAEPTVHGAPVDEPARLEGKPAKKAAPPQDESATGPLPVIGKRKGGAMDDLDLEELYDEVDAALSVVPEECPHCGGDNPTDARFCKHCSAPLKPWTCNHCGRVNDIDASFCVRCREPLQMLASPLDVEVIDE